MIPFHRDTNPLFFAYNVAQSAIEGRTVSNPHVGGTYQSFSILLPSGTGSLQLWANNGQEYINYSQSVDLTQTHPNYPGPGGQSWESLSANNVINPAFSGLWINITSAPVVQISASGFFVGDCTFKYVRLQGTGLTGSTSSAVGYFWTSDCVLIK